MENFIPISPCVRYINQDCYEDYYIIGVINLFSTLNGGNWVSVFVLRKSSKKIEFSEIMDCLR